ncbi:KUP/HAK/KT family potassium transporter [Myroides marinus]|uniref:KUP/HAK/KT family potassium transporter n=1 Tax=Myroides marinus TaxID=703342 RepID=UPI002575B2AA|nr:KUP/HAK/KT family potassium transporter [Myroides marinus]MDM1367513.1 KUP/HAK/KT family potassium transporter [Myroides marinus]MDM1370895.1 KUP/HAK/KT family potassium transporter [Myroides marinus]MDM1374012.1 KUP/HAK/KT family potassium transporter [Myroides marinus]MDM1383751.1 KUP/HAK/KT family potassium transporter [Myroides marinus]MDM1388485.1 KUP/HAK/KT family potassium transporter [Myroides marinus]
MQTSSSHGNHSQLSKITLGTLLVTLGIIYGDIGTSPLYVMKAIIGKEIIREDIVLGAISCVFWTLTLQTTIKYVFLTLKADNNGEGGIFSLYTLVKKLKKRWLLIPAIIGGSALLADGIITPPISISSAIEGLRIYEPNLKTIPIVIGIIFILFVIQQFGTKTIGKFFGPMMTLWFLMIGVIGLSHLLGNLAVLKAINPYYAMHLLSIHSEGYFVLGFVFLCTTGAEALYSDLGHCGIKNIRITWAFVKTMLVLCYFGQGAYLINYSGETLLTLSPDKVNPVNPFFLVMPEWFLPFGIAIATIAAVIASQALISGSFTLINEAIRLNLWPKVMVKFPTNVKGQLYIPSINWLLFLGCVFVVLHFEESGNMEAAYGLAITLCMIMTTILLGYYMYLKRVHIIIIAIVEIAYLSLEVSFFIANVQKFTHGGYVTVFIASLLAGTMVINYLAKKIRKNYTEFVNIEQYKDVLQDISTDTSIPKFASNLIYLTNSNTCSKIEYKILYSITQRRPKRADNYWFVHVHVSDQPYNLEYKIQKMGADNLIRVDFYLGFRNDQKISVLLKQVLKELVSTGEIDVISKYASLQKNNIYTDFEYVIIEKELSYDNELPAHEKIILMLYEWLKKLALSEEKAFGLDSSSVTVERFPMVINPIEELPLTRRE